MVELMNSPDELVALMAADKVLERARGKPKEMPDEAEADPAEQERRAEQRARVMKMLNDMAVPEPLHEVEPEREQRAPCRRESRDPHGSPIHPCRTNGEPKCAL